MNLSSSTSLRLNIWLLPACHEVMNTSLRLGFELGNGSNVWGTDVTRVGLPAPRRARTLTQLFESAFVEAAFADAQSANSRGKNYLPNIEETKRTHLSP